MQALDEDIREVKKEIVEIRSLVIRTNNLTSALGADLKTVAKKQKTYERRMLWNSDVAYVLFVESEVAGFSDDVRPNCGEIGWFIGDGEDGRILWHLYQPTMASR